MPLKDYSTTAASNTSAPPNGAPEGMTLANVNNVLRQMMADVRTLAAEDTIASAATCDLGTKDATFLTVSGVTTITSFGTVSAGIYKFVRFSGALTLTHNAISLILLSGANRTTVAGDCALYKSEGSGNWREYFYYPVGEFQPKDATLTALASALSAANKIPYATALNTLGELDLSTSTSLGTSNTTVSTQNAVKTYVDTAIVNYSTKSLTANGYQKFPGGLIVQWCSGTAMTSETTQAVSLPMTFPTGVLFAISGTENSAAGAGYDSYIQIVSKTTSSVTVFCQQAPGHTNPVTPLILAIGY